MPKAMPRAVILQTWEERAANHRNLLRELDCESGLTPTSEARRWRTWFCASMIVNLGLAIALATWSR